MGKGSHARKGREKIRTMTQPSTSCPRVLLGRICTRHWLLKVYISCKSPVPVGQTHLAMLNET